MKQSERVKKAMKKAKEDFDKIYEVYEGYGFVEVRGSYCGDMRCYRYYDNGTVTER